MERAVLYKSPFLNHQGVILETRNLTKQEKYFKIKLLDDRLLDHEPGQFVMAVIPGVGEAPISVSSSPSQVGYFELVVRRVGMFTTAMHQLGEGDRIGIRGPLGKGFPLQTLVGGDLLFVAGGLGIIPLRSLINYVIDNRRDFGRVNIIMGCKSPENLLFEEELALWGRRLDLNFACTVDRAAPEWTGKVGLITSLIPGVDLANEQTYAVIAGPPVMYQFVLAELAKKQIPEDQIFLSFERHMKCGVGHCGHCQFGSVYCCKDGPVFAYDKIKHNIEAF